MFVFEDFLRFLKYFSWRMAKLMLSWIAAFRWVLGISYCTLPFQLPYLGDPSTVVTDETALAKSVKWIFGLAQHVPWSNLVLMPVIARWANSDNSLFLYRIYLTYSTNIYIYITPETMANGMTSRHVLLWHQAKWCRGPVWLIYWRSNPQIGWFKHVRQAM